MPVLAHVNIWWGLLGLSPLVLYFVLIAVFTSSTALAVVAVLSALSAPSFTPIQLAVLYGFRSGLVNVAVRWGWVLAPVGLGAAALIRWA